MFLGLGRLAQLVEHLVYTEQGHQTQNSNNLSSTTITAYSMGDL